MSNENNLTFENDTFKYKSRVILGQAEVPKMTKFLMSKGIAKSEKTANILLLSITTLSLLLSIYVFAVFVFDVQLFNTTPEQLQLREEARERFNQIREKRQNNTNNTQDIQ
jgi:hypothetical protein